MSNKKTLANNFPRCAGVLLHPTSLPGSDSRWDRDVQGVLGASAYHFIDLLQNCGARVWQILPLVPTHSDMSPYMGLSVFAGNPNLISLDLLQNWGWLDGNIKPDDCDRQQAMHLARKNLETRKGQDYQDFQSFTREQAFWLDDYACFMAIRNEYKHCHWTGWPAPLRDREETALSDFKQQHVATIDDIKMQQFIFYRQWFALKKYANQRGVQMFGDMPIFVAHDSAEVWARPEEFDLNADGSPIHVAGVPPDYFSKTGQRWGNPLYRWSQMKSDDFYWWRQRVANALQLYDLVRIDHFRGFQAFWQIDAGEEFAINGKWIKAPGMALFKSLAKHFDYLPLVAEDLGVITDEVLELRDAFNFPGMKILQFAFDGNANNPYLPHNCPINSVVYTGTHDNDTSLGWYQDLPSHSQTYVESYLGDSGASMPWQLIRAALASTAFLAVIPMQDLMQLGSGYRMNTPGQKGENWVWRFKWDQIPAGMPERLLNLSKLFGRA